MDRGDEVRVVRQPQRRQRGDHVARDGPGDHRALGVARADDAERLAQEPVPRRRGHRVVRLVAQLERQPRIGARVARRDPLPQREERRVRPLEVVHVEHDREASRQPALDRAVHALVGDGIPAHGQPHEVEPRVADRVEPAVVELQLAAVERPAEADPAP